MSDGPHRSLPMRKGWKTFAQWSANRNFDPDQVASALPGGIEEDWREEGCPDLIRAAREVFGDSKQTALFPDSKTAELESLRRAIAGRPFQRLLLDCLIQESQSNSAGDDILSRAVESAIGQHVSRSARQVEEHWLRETSEKRTAHVRKRMEEGITKCDLHGLANRLLGANPSATTQRPIRRGGIDDGVRF